jgi:hypothetical protein
VSRFNGSRWIPKSCGQAGGGGGGGPAALSVDLVKVTADPLELGADLVSPQFNAFVTGGNPLTLEEIIDTDGNASEDILGLLNPVTMPYTYTRNAIGGLVDFMLSADDGTGVVMDTERYLWQPRVYLGVAAAGVVDEAFVEALAENELRADKGISRLAQTWTAGQFIYVAIPQAYNPTDPLDFLVTIGGSGFPGGFVLDTAGLAITPNTPGGVPILYDVWRSSGAGIGLLVDIAVSA